VIKKSPGVVSVRRVNTGQYYVKFNRVVKNSCIAIASPWENDQVGAAGAAEASGETWNPGSDPTELGVTTRNQTGTIADRSFAIAAFC
jgi:hypothetical protein